MILSLENIIRKNISRRDCVRFVLFSIRTGFVVVDNKNTRTRYTSFKITRWTTYGFVFYNVRTLIIYQISNIRRNALRETRPREKHSERRKNKVDPLTFVPTSRPYGRRDCAKGRSGTRRRRITIMCDVAKPFDHRARNRAAATVQKMYKLASRTGVPEYYCPRGGSR